MKALFLRTVAVIALSTYVLGWPFTCNTFAQEETPERFVELPARDIPVIDQVDLVVVGGSEGGMAAAWQAAKLGAKVILLNDAYSLGSEVTAKGRYLLDGPKPKQEFSQALFADMIPTAYRAKSDALMKEAGVVFMNNTRPGGVLIDQKGRLCGVITANKAGLQAVLARVVLDATYTGIVADQAGAQRTAWPADTTLQVSRARFKRGAKTLNEVVKEVPMPELRWDKLIATETLLRGYRQDRVGRAFAYSMHFTMPTHIIGAVQHTSATFPGPEKLNLDVCRSKNIDNLLLLGSSSALSRPAVQEMMRPVALAEVGQRLGAKAVEMANTVPAPSGKIVVKVNQANNKQLVPGMAVRELRESERPYRQKSPSAQLQQGPRHVTQARDAVPVLAEYDVVVVGGGPAGFSAAIAASRAGAKTLLVEQTGFVGGNTMIIRSFWRGYRHGFNQEWIKHPEHKAGRAPEIPMMLEAGVDIWYHTQAMGAVMQGKRVTGVEVATWLGRGAVLGKVVIDASGEADVCAAAGATTFYINDGDLCLEEASFTDIGLYMNVVPADPIDILGFTIHHRLAGEAASAPSEHMFPGKKTRTKPWDHMPMIQLRETRRIKGDYVINELDVNANRTYPDLIGIMASAFDPHGYYDSKYSFAGLMIMTKHVRDRDVLVNIPFRAILPEGLDGIMVAGRCYSATHDVQALARMNPDMMNQGYAAGYAAAMCVKDGTLPRDVDIKALQAHLAEVEILPKDQLPQLTQELAAPTDKEIATAALDASKRENLLILARGGQRSVTPLQAALKQQTDPSQKLATAKALCLLGNSDGVPVLVQWLAQQPLGQSPAYDWEGFLIVPEVDRVIWLLGIPQDKRAVPVLLEKLKKCRANTGFNRLRAILTTLGRIGDPSAAKPLVAFLERYDIQGHVDQGENPDSIRSDHFSKAIIELFAASALCRCGDHDELGKKILTNYLDDWRGVFVRYAGYVLEETR